MSLRVVGAGVGRTGTESLKLALERLLGGRCYHMLEVLQRPDAFAYWAAAARGEMPDWDEVFTDFVACVDWPAAAYWPEISAAYPDSLVLLSVRSSADEWYRSASDTIFKLMPGAGGHDEPAPAFIDDNMQTFMGMMQRFTTDVQQGDAAMAAYEAHNQRVRDSVPAGRLLEWQPGDGWGPICAALDVDVPDEPFPHVNTTAMFNARIDEMKTATGPAS
jgi:hypothetical protein